MYEDFYGLKSKPFQLSPDPDFYFSSKQHRRARAYLEYGVMRCEGFIVITGEVGAGKTTVVQGLLETLDSKSVVSANLVSTQLDAEDTLRLVAAAFGVGAKGASKGDLLMSLEAFFIDQSLQGKRCLLIVDEAQNLRAQAVEELRMLSNFQYGNKALLQTFLIGQPEFRKVLQSPEMLQLRQRVTATCHLGPLDLEETQEYIKHRLRCAGANDKLKLESEIFEIVYDYTDGVPRRINSLMDRVLLNGFLAEKNQIDISLVSEIIEEINAEMNFDINRSDKIKKYYENNNIFSKTYDHDYDLGLDNSLDSEFVENILQKIDNNPCIQLSSRVIRIEQSMLRQERISLEILVSLRKILIANQSIKKNENNDASEI